MGRLIDRVRQRASVQVTTVVREPQPTTGEPKPISECLERSVVTVQGELRSVTLRPANGVVCLEAELFDGLDSVTLIWLGRRGIQGIAEGRRLTVYGRLGRRDAGRVIYNPRYDLDA